MTVFHDALTVFNGMLFHSGQFNLNEIFSTKKNCDNKGRWTDFETELNSEFD